MASLRSRRRSGAPIAAALVAVLVASLAAALTTGGPVSATVDEGAADDVAPGGGRTLVVARPTWDTGWFQSALIAQLLVELGYRVEGPSTTENDRFYQEVQTGGIDLWVNGWFPLHDPLLPDESTGARRVGFEVEGGALQGYAVDRATSEAADIDTLADLADPETARLFDLDGDERADLIGCNVEWACHEIVDHHPRCVWSRGDGGSGQRRLRTPHGAHRRAAPTG